MFDFEWTGRSYGDETDRQRGIAAAKAYCTQHEIDAPDAWEKGEGGDWDDWGSIEDAAIKGLCKGWETVPENVSLVWINA